VAGPNQAGTQPMKVKPTTEYIQYIALDNGQVVRIERDDDDCGAGVIVWGFLAVIIYGLIAIALLCF